MKRQILVVDDDKLNRQILKNTLGNSYDILESGDGKDAIRQMYNYHKNISAVLLDIVMPVMDGYDVLAQIKENPVLTKIPVIVMTGSSDEEAEEKALFLGAVDFVTKPFNASIVRQRLRNIVKLRDATSMVNTFQKDALTGLYNRETFLNMVMELTSRQKPGHYILASFNVDNFKVINEQYGTKKADEMLRSLGEIFSTGFNPIGGVCCRMDTDNFAILYPRSFADSNDIERIRDRASSIRGSVDEIVFNVGRYIVDDLSLSASVMYDRATLARESIGELCDSKITVYNESMREHLIHEQEIVTDMRDALANEEFEIWFQPQYDNTSGALIGAEALARWRHPQKGILLPCEFIPTFERNGFIYELDKFVWERVCIQMCKRRDKDDSTLPISVNVSRSDILHSDFYDTITGLVKKYGIPAEQMQLEITESAFSRSAEPLAAMVKRLADFGFTVAIDNFGSELGSLNIIRDVPVSVLKLDMKFMSGGDSSPRGGDILESIVRLAPKLGMSVFAEGVETQEQADFLKSIGCGLVQGYLYAKPMTQEEYKKLLKDSGK
ncbi:MAG: EAL domain-containing protein [Synergistaceae bacterium]|nr:EAL domain-containing protein [Synergistaceae bacterium]